MGVHYSYLYLATNHKLTCKAGKKRGSFSTRMTLLGLLVRMERVIAPGPGPTSITSPPPISPAARTNLSVILKSNKKFCDSCLNAFSLYSFIISLIVGSGGKQRSIIDFTLDFNILSSITNQIHKTNAFNKVIMFLR